jgi:DNA-binding Xre family transcriptional regulator
MQEAQEKHLAYKWALGELMARRGIRFAIDLHRRLEESGCDVSRQTVNQWVKEGSGRSVRVPHLMALCEVLECKPQDLLATAEAHEPI